MADTMDGWDFLAHPTVAQFYQQGDAGYTGGYGTPGGPQADLSWQSSPGVTSNSYTDQDGNLVTNWKNAQGQYLHPYTGQVVDTSGGSALGDLANIGMMIGGTYLGAQGIGGALGAAGAGSAGVAPSVPSIGEAGWGADLGMDTGTIGNAAAPSMGSGVVPSSTSGTGLSSLVNNPNFAKYAGLGVQGLQLLENRSNANRQQAANDQRNSLISNYINNENANRQKAIDAYTNLDVTKTPDYNNVMDSVYNKLLREDAVGGRVSNPINRQAALTRAMADWGTSYKSNLLKAYSTGGASPSVIGNYGTNQVQTNYTNPIGTAAGIATGLKTLTDLWK